MSKPKLLEYIRRAVYILIPLGWMIAHGVMIARADITCVRNDDGSWTCYGDGGGAGDPSSNTNGTVCATNRIVTLTRTVNSGGLSYPQCVALRSSLDSLLDSETINAEFEQFSEQYSTASDLIQEYLSDIKSETGYYNDDRQMAVENSVYDLYILGESCYQKLADLSDLSSTISCLPPSSTEVALTNESVVCTSCSSSGSSGGTGGDGSCGCNCSELLQSIYQEVLSTKQILTNSFNQLKKINDTLTLIKNAFYGHTGIKVTASDGSWTNIYNSGIAFGFNYNKSNVLERIELLLYSLTSANQTGTNYLSNASYSIDDLKSSLETGFDEFQTEFQSQKQTFVEFKDKFTQLFNLFNPLGSNSFSPSAVVPQASIEIGNFTGHVPDLVLSGYTGNSSVTSYIDFLRHTIQVVYLLGSLFFVWRFYCFFFVKVTSFIKWASEIVNGLFG